MKSLVTLKQKLKADYRVSILFSALWLSMPFYGEAQENGGDSNTESVQPYIDRIKEDLLPKPEDPAEGFTDRIKKNMERQGSDEDAEGSYIEQLKEESSLKKPVEKSFIETKKAELAPKTEGGAIEAVAEGRSDLEMKRPGNIHHAFGVRFAATANREIKGAQGSVANSFDSIYGQKYAPDLSLFYEFQPFHSEWFGNIGLVGMLGISIFKGQGDFAFAPQKPGGGSYDLSGNNTKLQFLTVPVVVGAVYRFNLLRILRPYIMIGPAAIGYLEQRSDGAPDKRGYSTGVLWSGGVSLLLDWIGGHNTWDLYADHGIKHFYLSVDYSKLTTLAGAVNFGQSGIVAGLTFEL